MLTGFTNSSAEGGGLSAYSRWGKSARSTQSMQQHRGPIKSHFVNKRSHLRVIIYERAVATVISLTVGHGR